MKKYINPEVEIYQVGTSNVICTSLPKVDGSTVDGSQALGKDADAWDDEEEIEEDF